MDFYFYNFFCMVCQHKNWTNQPSCGVYAPPPPPLHRTQRNLQSNAEKCINKRLCQYSFCIFLYIYIYIYIYCIYSHSPYYELTIFLNFWVVYLFILFYFNCLLALKTLVYVHFLVIMAAIIYQMMINAWKREL